MDLINAIIVASLIILFLIITPTKKSTKTFVINIIRLTLVILIVIFGYLIKF